MRIKLNQTWIFVLASHDRDRKGRVIVSNAGKFHFGYGQIKIIKGRLAFRLFFLFEMQSAVKEILLTLPQLYIGSLDLITQDYCCSVCPEDGNMFSFICCGMMFCISCIQDSSKCPSCQSDVPEELSETILSAQQRAKINKDFELAHYYDSDCTKISSPLIKKNDAESFRLILGSAKKGYRNSQFKIGLMYHYGRGVEKSMKDAFYWYTLAANQGSIDSLNSLGVMIVRGDIQRSVSDAHLLFQKAADDGNPEAQCNVAITVYMQLNTEDYPNALFWFKKAALQKHHRSQFYIAKVLFKLNQQIPTAMYWLRKSAGAGFGNSIGLLKEKEIEIASKCSLCLKSLNGTCKGKKCTKCKAVYYCSKECQVKDWKENHKKECIVEINEKD